MVCLGLQVNIIQQVDGREIPRALQSFARNNFTRSPALSQGCVLDKLSVVLRYQLYQKQSANWRNKCQKQLTNTSTAFVLWLKSSLYAFLFTVGVTDLESETHCCSVCEQLFFEQIIQVCGRLAQPAFWAVSSINLGRWRAGSCTGVPIDSAHGDPGTGVLCFM